MKELLEKQIALQLETVKKLIPINHVLARIEIVDSDHEMIESVNDVAITELEWGARSATIYINKDHRYWKEKNWQAILFGVLLHEFGHIEESDLIGSLPKSAAEIGKRLSELSSMRAQRLGVYAWGLKEAGTNEVQPPST